MTPRRILFLLFFSLLAPRASLLAANVYLYIGPTGQSLYGRVEETSGNFVAFALVEGTGGAKGKYYATEANIVAAGLDTASTGDGFIVTVHSGATPSTTAEDPISGNARLKWTGSTEDTSSGTGGSTPDTRDLEPVQFAWTFNRRADGTLESTNTLTIAPGEKYRCGFKCDGTNVLPTGVVLQSMTTPTVTNTACTASKLGIDPTSAKVEVTAEDDAANGTRGYVRTTVMNNNGAGPVTLLGRFEIVEEPE